MRNINPVPLCDVKIDDPFWNRSLSLVRDVVIPYQWDALNDRVADAEHSNCIKNFEIAAGRCTGEFQGFVFQDSDLYKWLESVAYSLETHPDPDLEKKADSAIDLLAEAQMPDGYLNTYFQLKAPNARWSNLNQAHELYCAGHLIEAAVAYYQATGKRKLLDVAIRFADLIDSLFGYEEGKSKGCPGHQEIELALVKIWKSTGDERYLKLAAHFLQVRGMEPCYFEDEMKKTEYHSIWTISGSIDKRYNQCHLPPVKQTEAAGHAVRAVYMYSAMADIAAFCGDGEFLKACRVIFDDISNKQMYITGGIGSTYHGEAFSGAYDLPNDSAYAETCASIGLMMFCQRMYLIEHDGRYIDVMERALYNTVLSGMSLSGREFFYVNPLEVHSESNDCNPGLKHVKTTRQPWFACACCPPNLARTLMSLGSYAYSSSENELYVNLYLSSEVTCPNVKVAVETDYPWGGKAKITANGTNTLYFRSPAAAPVITLIVNGAELSFKTDKGYITVPVDGSAVIELTFDVTPKFVYTHTKSHHTIGKTAIQRGPVVYCAESADNEYPIGSYFVSHDAAFSELEAPVSLPENTQLLIVEAFHLVSEDTILYTTVPPSLNKSKLTLIPYHLWGNRDEGEMAVYINTGGTL